MSEISLQERAAAVRGAALHQALATMSAPISAEDLLVVLARDFPEIQISGGLPSLVEYLGLLWAANLVSISTNHESGALVYEARKP